MAPIYAMEIEGGDLVYMNAFLSSSFQNNKIANRICTITTKMVAAVVPIKGDREEINACDKIKKDLIARRTTITTI